VLITLVGLFSRHRQFFLLVPGVDRHGRDQALSRSLFASLIATREMFGFFGVFDRFGGALGSIVFGVVLSATGSSRPAILALIAFFAAGGFILSKVDVARGALMVAEPGSPLEVG
jgi:UMF1 family MFS transporter